MSTASSNRLSAPSAARSRRLFISFATEDAAGRLSLKTMDDFKRKGLAASTIFEMTRWTVLDAPTFGCADRRP
jgi:hypothetical protein